jgi:D-glycero-alpha-D-manno-heptose-7-phosphate kinase
VPDARLCTASAPTRLDFGGGWTDVPPFPEERGGFVCSVAIDRRATVTLRDTGRDRVEHHDLPLLHAALARAGLLHLSASLHNDFPVSAGLGGSSAAGVALEAAIASWRRQPVAAHELAESSRALEVESLGVAGGRQDHYAAAYGGALGLSFGSSVGVAEIPLSDDRRAQVEARCLVYYTGESRISGETIQAVLDRYAQRDASVVFALDRMAALARLMATALSVGDLDSLGALVGEHWVHQRSLHPGIPTARIDEIITQALAAGALGGKPLGASGGGCVVVVCPADRIDAIRSAIGTLAEPVPFRVATRGVVTSITDASPDTGAPPAPIAGA